MRFADDYVAGLQHREDAERFLADLRERFANFALELAPEKTRLIEFGRYAAERRKTRGLPSPRRSCSWASRTYAEKGPPSQCSSVRWFC